MPELTPERKLVVAIDGPAASGKSTTARNVARRLGYVYIDTGAMYRAATLATLRAGVDPDDRHAVEELVAATDIRLESESDGSLRVFLNGGDVTDAIRSRSVTAHVSAVSSYPEVRRRMVALQQQMGAAGGVVLDGRDIGTVVFPDADVKVFMVADIAARAQRRGAELVARGDDVDLDGLRADIERRDRLDSTRATSPLVRASDAVEIDTSELSIEQQVERVIELVRRKSHS